MLFCSEVFIEAEGTRMNVLLGLNLVDYLVVGFFVCLHILRDRNMYFSVAQRTKTPTRSSWV